MKLKAEELKIYLLVKNGITELIPIFSKIRCSYCVSEFQTIYSLKRHKFTKHIRSFKCEMYIISQDGENKECGEIFRDRKSCDKHRLSVHHKL